MVRLPVFWLEALEPSTLNTRRFLLRLPELLSRWRRERSFPIYRLKSKFAYDRHSAETKSCSVKTTITAAQTKKRLVPKLWC
jgi:hypothetical protein